MEVLSWKVPMGRVRLKDLSEPSLDGVGGPDQLLPGKGLGVSRGGRSSRSLRRQATALGQVSSQASAKRPCGGIHDGMEASLADLR